ncbi:alpha/beta hydrolase [Pseudomonas sp. PS02288]|nr:alpha/beta hydrolase [Pseudomonas sp. PS02288]
MYRRWLPALVLCAAATVRAETPSYGAQLEGFDYPYPVQHFEFESQGGKRQMAYMDVLPERPNGGVLVLLHGKNFCAATWEGTIRALTGAGYRVVVPDQIGFCKSSKPEHYQYSFQQLASNTHALLQSLGIERFSLLGHSMGGMLATRYALMYPHQLEQLVLVDPIGLEDWKAKGVPYRRVDEWYARELNTTAESIRSYQRSTYYAGQWQQEWDNWVQMQAGMFNGPGREAVAWSSALTYDMIQTQPVYYELERIEVPTLLIIGEKDTTAIGKDAAPEALRSQLGNYPKLAKEAAARIPGAVLVTFPDLGHSPQIQAPERFHQALLKGLVARPGG